VKLNVLVSEQTVPWTCYHCALNSELTFEHCGSLSVFQTIMRRS